MKELAKAAEQEKPISPTKKQTIQEQEVLFFQEIKAVAFKQNQAQNNRAIADHYSNLYFHLNSFSVFHPPTVA